MAVGFILDFAEGSAAQYDQVIDDMQLDGRVVADGQFHVAGPGPDGGWRVVDVWDSDEAFSEFAREQIGPISQKHGFSEPQISRFDVHNTRDTGAPRSDIAFFQVVRLGDLDAESFDAMDGEITGGAAPDGCLFHVAGPLSDGGWVVTDGWSSKDVRDAFLRDKVMPVVGANPDATPPDIEDMDVHNTLEPPA